MLFVFNYFMEYYHQNAVECRNFIVVVEKTYFGRSYMKCQNNIFVPWRVKIEKKKKTPYFKGKKCTLAKHIA